MAMGTLESTNNFMPFPCNLQLNRRQRFKLQGLLPLVSSLFTF